MYPIARYTLLAISLAGWAIVFLSSFMVSHFDLFGLRQVWLKLRGRPYEHVEFRLVGFYKLVRHPLMVGFLIAFWATPEMTVAHLLFAVMTTAYMLSAIRWEENDLIKTFGEKYIRYKQHAPMLIPFTKRKAKVLENPQTISD